MINFKESPCANGHYLDDLYVMEDAQGIPFPVGYVCDHCYEWTLQELKKKYKPEVFSGYTQDDVGEPIDDNI